MTEFLFNHSLLTPTSISQASLWPHLLIPVSSLQTLFIVTRTPTSRVRLMSVAQSHVHTLPLSWPICHLIQTAQDSHFQGCHPPTRPYFNCVTLVRSATRPFTMLRRCVLTGYPRRHHHGRLKEFLLPLRTNSSVLLPTTFQWFSRAIFLSHRR